VQRLVIVDLSRSSRSTRKGLANAWANFAGSLPSATLISASMSGARVVVLMRCTSASSRSGVITTPYTFRSADSLRRSSFTNRSISAGGVVCPRRWL
jgi:hypothetical protein